MPRQRHSRLTAAMPAAKMNRLVVEAEVRSPENVARNSDSLWATDDPLAANGPRKAAKLAKEYEGKM